MKRWIVFVVVVAVCAGGGWWLWRWYKNRDRPVNYRIAKVERGDLVQTVRATGQVSPIRLVQVGAQVTGPIKNLYADYNSKVKAGDLVAQIDPAVYEARVAQDQASLRQGMAGVEQAKARLVQAEKDLVRGEELARRDLMPKADLEAAVANRDVLAAQVKVAQAQVEQTKATLLVSEANLGYTTIRSPVDGVVIARNVSEGQTVVASMSVQPIFDIATDLSKIQVEASIPEADVGKIRTNQTAKFTVDAHDQEFRGTVAQVRLAAKTVQNVVTYPVIVTADNPDGKLFPSMTANITFEVARRTDVLKIPNAALRFKPNAGKPQGDAKASSKESPSVTSKETASVSAKVEASRPGREGRASGEGRFRAGKERVSRSQVWVRGEKAPEPIPVTLGIGDGSFTEMKEGDLKEGQEVITGVLEADSDKKEINNPFGMPKMPGGGRPPR